VDVLRTPDERFDGLADWRYQRRYVEVEGAVRVHYVDEGEGEPVLLLHGEPTWSYLYRKMIPVIVDAGLRAVAVDLVGFGRSDKPAAREDYTYQRHVDWVRAALDRIGLTSGVTLFGQDWGGLIGLRLVGEEPDRFSRVVAANTFLPTGDGKPSDAFLAWQRYSQETPNFHVGGIVKGGCAQPVSDEVVAAYDAPFPDDSYKAAARQFPVLVPTSPDDPAVPANRRAWEGLVRFEKPFLCAFSDSDPVTRGSDRPLRERIPGAKDQPHTTIAGGGHFLQEDRGEELAYVLVDFVRTA
jgi:haloalkane dehalogenase